MRGTDGYFHNTTASVSINHFISGKWNIALRSSYDNRNFAAQNFYTTSISDTATEKVTSLWNHLHLGYNATKHSFTFNAGYKSVKDHFLFNNKSTANENKSNLLQGLAVYKYQPTEKTSITTGANLISKQITSNDKGNHILGQIAGFATLNHLAARNFYVNPAIRAQWTESIGWGFVPQVNLFYKLTNWQLRVSAGKITRDADFTEPDNNYNKPLVPGGSVGNPNLKAEKSFSYEAGADFFVIKNMRVSTTLFRRNFTELIDFVTTPYAEMPRKDNLSPTGTFALAKNIAKLTSTGLETDVMYSSKFKGEQQLNISAGLTWIDTEGENLTPSFYITSHAKFLTNFNVQYRVRWFSMSINGLFKQRQERAATAINAAIDKEYFALNTMMLGFIYKRKLSAFTQLDNAFNKRYSDLLGSQMPGRWLMGGFKLLL